MRLRLIVVLASLGVSGTVRAQGGPSAPLSGYGPGVPEPWPKNQSAGPPRPRAGFLLMPFLGVHSFLSYPYDSYRASLRVGALAGGYVSEGISLNGGAMLDVHSPAWPGWTGSGQTFELAFTPLGHSGNIRAEAVFGPKVGTYVMRDHLFDLIRKTSVDATELGWLAGAQVGFFVALTPKKLAGILTSVEYRNPLSQACSQPAGNRECALLGEGVVVVGAMLALML